MEEFNMTLNKYLDIAPEVQKALDEGRPVVALESTIISHGMPYPQNVETALNVEKIIRENGAVPATIAVIGGRLKAGLSEAEIDYLGKTGTAVAKASRRDLPVLVAEGKDGATTVTTTMIIAHMAGIQVFATGGIGGVHRGAQQTFDISADLEELAHTPVMVVCAGANVVVDRMDTSFLANVNDRAVQLRAGIAKLPHVKSISGIGLMVGIEFYDLKAADVLAACREAGLLVLTAKTRLRLLPPLTLSEHDVDMALEILSDVLGKMEPTAPKEQA